MNDTQSSYRAIGTVWRVAAIAAAYFVGTMIGGGLITALGWSWPSLPEPPSQAESLVLNLVGAVLMAVCLMLLAVGIRGSVATRWLILAAFSYVCFGLNNQIEAAIFTTFGGTSTMILFLVFPCALSAAAAALLCKPEEHRPSIPTIWSRQPASNWWWRVVVAWLAFPVIYLIFGMLASPFVVPVYRQQDFGLTLPGMGTILPVALLRSALYLAVTLPIIASWTRSRRSLILSLGFAFFAMMGLIGLLTTTFFPPLLRIVHSVEILCDALFYAWVLIALLAPRSNRESRTPSPEPLVPTG